MFIDSHCHLIHSAYLQPEEVVKRAVEAGVKKMYCTSGMAGDEAQILALCSKYPNNLFPVIGITPHDANKVSEEQKEALFDFVEKNRKKIAGIGEIGLDFHYFKTPEEQKKQMTLFKEEIELAKTSDLPIIIHSRKAEEQVLNILKEANFTRFAMHCFIVKKLAEKVVGQGGLISLPTIKSKERKYIMKHISLENLLCETDSPYLWQGKNEPANVKEVYENIAKAKEVNIEKVEAQIEQNVTTFFGE